MKESAVEFLVEQLQIRGYIPKNSIILNELFKQAKLIESEQKVYSYDDLIEAFVMGRLGETIKKFNGKFKKK